MAPFPEHGISLWYTSSTAWQSHLTQSTLLALPGYEELIIQRAVQRDLGGWTVWICSAVYP